MGPLKGRKIIEIAGLGPAPFCGMLLADMGAEVILIDRAETDPNRLFADVMTRGKRSIAIDLKTEAGRDTLLKLCESADALIEGFRPEVAERLGIGPDDCFARNDKLVYGRMTGWGQTGPLAASAGHDINYISLAGALHAIGEKDRKPVPPLSLVGDFGGGGMMMAYGLVCGILEAQQSGKGQVIDAAMIDGAALLMSIFFTFQSLGMQSDERGSNLVDGGAHFYDTYETSDNKYIAVGALEPQFYSLLLEELGIDNSSLSPQMDRSSWQESKDILSKVFRTKTRDQWCEQLEGKDACFSPVLALNEVHKHPHNIARETFVEIDGLIQPAPAPRFSRSKADIPRGSRVPGRDSREILSEVGLTDKEITYLVTIGAVMEAK